ncbi:glycosyltransferase [Pengzhenrongella sp.]|uniref:glycosyltransferase n=1 Tax=Pengzhenrongella sp. TaxID=2888820 RepID=UPI002F95C0C2
MTHEIGENRPDLIHAGPVTDVAYTVAGLWDGPMIAGSWGFDLMDEVDQSETQRDHAAEVMRRADVVLVDNDGPARRAVELGAAAGALVQLPWGVDLAYFSPGCSNLRSTLGWDDKRIVVSTRRHEAIYRVDVIVRAFVKVANEYQDLRLLVVGGGSLSSDLWAVVERVGLVNRVVFMGESNTEIVRDAYRAADLYVSASAVDGTSVSLLEAMACGAPVCVSAIEGNSQWITEASGLKFVLDDIDDLARRLADVGKMDGGIDVRSERRAQEALRMVQKFADWSRSPAQLIFAAELAIERHGSAS